MNITRNFSVTFKQQNIIIKVPRFLIRIKPKVTEYSVVNMCDSFNKCNKNLFSKLNDFASRPCIYES